MKDLTVSNSARSAADGHAAAVVRNARDAQRWAREVLRRGVLELLYLGSNLAIAGSGLLWLYQLLTRKPALKTGLVVAAALAISLFAYHFARWRASATMSRHVEKLAASMIVALSMALAWGGICCAFAFGALRWFSAPGTVSWIVGGTAGLCGFAHMVATEWRDLSDCLALPTEEQNRQSLESVA